MLTSMDTKIYLPPLRLCGQAFLFAWRMGLFFSPVVVSFAPHPAQYLIIGRVAFLIAFASALMGVFLLARHRSRALSDRALTIWGSLLAAGGSALVIASSFANGPFFALSIAGFAVAGIGDAFITLACAKLYSTLSVRLSMRVVPVAMAVAAIIYAVVANNASVVAVGILVALSLACGVVLLGELGGERHFETAEKPTISQIDERASGSFTKWKISSYTSVLWLSFGVMWPLAAVRMFEDGSLFLPFSLSVAALIAIVSFAVAAFTYLLKIPTVKIFWIFVPLMFAGITVVAVADSNIQVLAFAMIFAAHNIAEIQLITHFSAICRRRGYSTKMLFGCGFSILSVGELLGILIGAAMIPVQSALLTMALLVCANAIVIVVIFSIVRVNATFQRAELKAALSKHALESLLVENGGSASGNQAANRDTDAIVKMWADRYGLSAREREIANLVLLGRNVPAIAELLVISQSTVQTHVKHIYEKTGVHSRQELVDLRDEYQAQ